ncbi:MAG: phosphatidate cytidylyltransferase [Oscillospiraceae bacterium]|nr:phosphatidate cytidylyltransferase [Oscillospiraceae bacterium]
MKKKVIAGICCAIAGISVVALRGIAPWLFPLAAAVVSIMATYEINHALGIKNKLMNALTVIVSFAIPMCFGFRTQILALGEKLCLTLNPVYFLLLYGLLCFIIMIADFENIKFHDAASVIVTTWGIPFAVTVLLHCNEIEKLYPNAGYEKHHGLFFILYVMFCAWLTDVFAYFAGSFLGKHKLCPKVSPKKTVEGAVGGVIGGVASVLILYAIFENFVFEVPHGKYLTVALVSAVLCIAGMFGDLTFSVLKRNRGVKDFSNLVPGHGGMMDRFDSEVFVLIAFYAVINIFGVVF